VLEGLVHSGGGSPDAPRGPGAALPSCPVPPLSHPQAFWDHRGVWEGDRQPVLSSHALVLHRCSFPSQTHPHCKNHCLEAQRHCHTLLPSPASTSSVNRALLHALPHQSPESGQPEGPPDLLTPLSLGLSFSTVCHLHQPASSWGRGLCPSPQCPPGSAQANVVPQCP
jgi:hypothetical protein